ncbi:DUF2726 domain-containing protein [Oceanisphaera ostreae]|uniref:DUF2726 domain-containing protein n=1 Tax=Oceanisphaera ostreae TaxID=914151 RepID=A0ABW3KEG9_9GAMM
MNMEMFTSSTLMTVISVLFFIVVALLSVKARSKKSIHPYQRLNTIFTPAERSFFGVLSQAVGDDALIFGKVRVADVLTPKKSTVKGVWQTAFNKISAKHFDFVLCSKDDLSFLCAIELDDRSHNSAKRQVRDAFLEDACESAIFPLIRFSAKSGYKISDVRDALKVVLGDSSAREAVSAAANTQSFENLESRESSVIGKVSASSDLKQEHKKSCPKCASEMTLRVAKKGSSAGNEFWGCSAFPKCRYIEPLSN